MKPMGTPPPIDKGVDKIKREIYAQQCKAMQEKPPIPKEVMSDQFGGYSDFEECGSRLSCCDCGAPFSLGAGFVHDGSLDIFWCESCFREMAYEKYGIK